MLSRNLRSLMREIIANPEEDTLRLAYADALEEEGQGVYAEFIRWQIGRGDRGAEVKLTWAPSWDGRDHWIPIGWRVESWLEVMRSMLPSPKGLSERNGIAFSRGFVDDVDVGFDWWVRNIRAIELANPVRRCVVRVPGDTTLWQDVYNPLRLHNLHAILSPYVDTVFESDGIFHREKRHAIPVEHTA